MYMRQAQAVSPAPGSNPAATVNMVAVQQDLLQIARAEQQHLASDGRYLTLQEMRAAGDTGLPPDSRGPYSYSAEVSGESFTVTATCSGPAERRGSSGVAHWPSNDDQLGVIGDFERRQGSQNSRYIYEGVIPNECGE